MTGGQSRFSILDGMRFIAALAVAIFHFTLFAGVPLLQHGYLGVDFFFVLSGFVISFAYSDKFAKGGSLKDFLLKRFIRLYPMIIFGSVLGIFLSVFEATSLADFVSSILLIPNFNSFIFPVNVPIWSLFYEIFVNIGFALISIIGSKKATVFYLNYVFALVFILCLFANVYYVVSTNSLDNGSIASTFIAGFPRAGQSFCAGVLLHRVSGSSNPIRSTWLLVLIGSLIACMAVPFFQKFDGLFELSITTFAFPLIVYFGSKIHVRGKTAAFCDRAGSISYPLYLIHFPVLVIVLHYTYGPTWLIRDRVVGLLFLVVVSSILVYYLYDDPARLLLRKLLYKTPKDLQSR